MGFKITLNYDKAVLSSPRITAGDITEKGMINDSVGVSTEGTVDIVWNTTENVCGDGTLVTLSFTVDKPENTVIKINYSQPDTFNEAWEDVELKCSDISVVFYANAIEEGTKESSLSGQPSGQPSCEEIKNAVDIALGETDKDSIDKISEEEKTDFVNRVNGIISRLTGGTDKQFENIDCIKEAYNNAVSEVFINNTMNALDSNKIDSAINNSLASVGAESIEQIPSEKIQEFVHAVEIGIAQYAPDVEIISDKLTADESIKVIQQLKAENDEAATSGKKVPELQTENITATHKILIGAVIFVAAAVTGVAVLFIKRKKNKEAN